MISYGPESPARPGQRVDVPVVLPAPPGEASVSEKTVLPLVERARAGRELAFRRAADCVTLPIRNNHPQVARALLLQFGADGPRSETPVGA